MKWAVGFLFTCLSGLAWADKPTVVSLDYCADQFVLGLADREQILALSKDSERPFSYLRDQAGGIPKVRASAEDVIALQPDIVIRSWGGDGRALAFYKRFGIETVQIGYAGTVEGTAEITREVARALGQVERGKSLVVSMPPAADPSGRQVLYLTASGYTAGRGTMVDSIMRRAGLENAIDASGWQPLPLEQLVLAPPEFALTAFFRFDDDRTDHWSLTRHPVMQRILKQARTIPLTESRLTCPAWFVADEASDVADAAKGSP